MLLKSDYCGGARKDYAHGNFLKCFHDS
jgi:hypothetical protein